MDNAITFSESPVTWIFSHILQAVIDLFNALSSPSLWLDWLSWDNTTEDKQSLMRFIYYGASTEFFFVFLFTLISYTIAAMVYRPLMWRTVITLEGMANRIGRFFCLGRINHGADTDYGDIHPARLCCFTNHAWLWDIFFF